MKKLYIVAALLALVSAVVIYQFALYLEQISVAEAVPQSDIVVAAVAIPEYTVITEEMVTVRTVPTVSVMQGAAVAAEEIIGRVSTAPFVQNEQILVEQTAVEGAEDPQRLSVELTSGMTAYVLNVSVTSGAAGYIQKGDRVSLASVRSVTSADGTASMDIEVFMRNIEVIRVNSSASENALDYTSLVLEVSDEEALLLTYYESLGTVKAFLSSLFTETDGTRVIDREKENNSVAQSALTLFSLSGIFYNPNAASQAIITTATATYVLSVGDNISDTGWNITSIGENAVVIEKNGSSETLYPQTGDGAQA